MSLLTPDAVSRETYNQSWQQSGRPFFSCHPRAVRAADAMVHGPKAMPELGFVACVDRKTVVAYTSWYLKLAVDL